MHVLQVVKMSNLVLVPVLLVLSFFSGAVIAAQWFPQKNGDPPRKPFKQGVAVGLVVGCGVIAVGLVALAVASGSVVG